MCRRYDGQCLYARFKHRENATVACERFNDQSLACELCPVTNLRGACCPNSGKGCVGGRGCNFIHTKEPSRNDGLQGGVGGGVLVEALVKGSDVSFEDLFD